MRTSSNEALQGNGIQGGAAAHIPSGKSHPTPEDDRFWPAAIDLDIPITIHHLVPRRPDERDVYLMHYPKDPQGEARPFDFLQRLACHGIYHCGAVEATQLIFAGVFERFPKRQIYGGEQHRLDPNFYQQVDQTFKVTVTGRKSSLGLAKLKKLPSEYLREHAHWGVFDDPVGIQLRHMVGVDRIMWSTDFPHTVTHWPKSLELVETQFAGVPHDERRKMLADNAAGRDVKNSDSF